MYSPPVGTYGISGTPISSSAYDTFINDLATELTNSLNVQGTAPMLGALNMGTFPINNVGAPVALTDAATKGYVDAGISPGLIMAYAIDTGPPAGWLSADGSSVSTTTYVNLFATIAYAYGGSGANFNVPDFRGCFLRGFDNGRGLDFQSPRAVGAYQASYLTNHFHTVSDPQHFHTITDPSHTHGAVTGGHNHPDPGHTHTIANGAIGTGSQLQSGFSFAGTAANVTGNSVTNIGAVGNIGVTVFNGFTGINSTNYGFTGIGVSNVSTGNVNSLGTETTVQNYPVLWCIKY